jgi:hypothetical protein
MATLPITVSHDAEKPDEAAAPVITECALPTRIQPTGSGADRLRSLSNGGLKFPETVNEAYRRLVLNAPSLLPRCDMPVARMLFAEWLAEQEARNK